MLKWREGVNIRLRPSVTMRQKDDLSEPKYLSEGVEAWLDGDVVTIAGYRETSESRPQELRVSLSNFDYVIPWGL